MGVEESSTEVLRGETMSIAHQDQRIAGRRKETRRIYDMLRGLIEEEERQQYDCMWTRVWLCENRRVEERRSGEDRRVDD